MIQKRDFSPSPFLDLYPNSSNTQFTVQHQYRKINRTARKTASSQLLLRKIRNRTDVPLGCIAENSSAESKQYSNTAIFKSVRVSPQKWDNLLEDTTTSTATKKYHYI